MRTALVVALVLLSGCAATPPGIPDMSDARTTQGDLKEEPGSDRGFVMAQAVEVPPGSTLHATMESRAFEPALGVQCGELAGSQHLWAETERRAYVTVHNASDVPQTCELYARSSVFEAEGSGPFTMRSRVLPGAPAREAALTLRAPALPAAPPRPTPPVSPDPEAPRPVPAPPPPTDTVHDFSSARVWTGELAPGDDTRSTYQYIDLVATLQLDRGEALFAMMENEDDDYVPELSVRCDRQPARYGTFPNPDAGYAYLSVANGLDAMACRVYASSVVGRAKSGPYVVRTDVVVYERDMLRTVQAAMTDEYADFSASPLLQGEITGRDTPYPMLDGGVRRVIQTVEVPSLGALYARVEAEPFTPRFDLDCEGTDDEPAGWRWEDSEREAYLAASNGLPDPLECEVALVGVVPSNWPGAFTAQVLVVEDASSAPSALRIGIGGSLDSRDRPTLALPGRASGRITAASPTELTPPVEGISDWTTRRVEGFDLTVPDGAYATVTMESSAFDTYLLAKTDRYYTDAFNDDADGSTERSVLHLGPGAYLVLASAFQPEAAGDFSLRAEVRRATARSADGWDAVLSGAITPSDDAHPLDAVLDPYEADAYPLTLRRGQTLVVRLAGDQPDFGTALALLRDGSGAVARADDSDADDDVPPPTELRYTATATGAYTLLAGSWASGTMGPYVLRYRIED